MRIHIHMDLFSGPSLQTHLRQRRLDYEISDNVGENTGDDFVHMGWGGRISFSGTRAPRLYPN